MNDKYQLTKALDGVKPNTNIMGWFQYYKLLEQYDGDLSKATKQEMKWAADGNPNNPHTARALAERKYREEHGDIPQDLETFIQE